MCSGSLKSNYNMHYGGGEESNDSGLSSETSGASRDVPRGYARGDRRREHMLDVGVKQSRPQAVPRRYPDHRRAHHSADEEDNCSAVLNTQQRPPLRRVDVDDVSTSGVWYRNSVVRTRLDRKGSLDETHGLCQSDSGHRMALPRANSSCGDHASSRTHQSQSIPRDYSHRSYNVHPSTTHLPDTVRNTRIRHYSSEGSHTSTERVSGSCQRKTYDRRYPMHHNSAHDRHDCCSNPRESPGSNYSRDSIKAIQDSGKFCVREWEMARFASKVNKSDFRICDPQTAASAERNQYNTSSSYYEPVSGILTVSVIAGINMQSSHAVLRDLYCVMEIDSSRRARTRIRTSTECFEWHEEFEIDVCEARCLTLLLYQWNSKGNPKLCFYSSICIVRLVADFNEQFIRAEKLALKLEPKGLLYLELAYEDLRHLLLRQPSLRSESVFGTPLELTIRRDNMCRLVPAVVVKCIEEIESRGIDVEGLYNVSSSVHVKQKLRCCIEKSWRTFVSAAKEVPDTHTFTDILKSYFRELPEPLFTNSFYPLLLDACQVRLPGNQNVAPKLLFSIMECLPDVNQHTIVCLFDHLKRVVQRCEFNKMSSQSISMVFGAILVCPASHSVGTAFSNKTTRKQINVVQHILDVWPVEVTRFSNESIPKFITRCRLNLS